MLPKCDRVCEKLRRARPASSDCVQEGCGAAGRGGADAAKSHLVREDCEKTTAAKSDRVCVCVCVISSFNYPATCGPKGHGSGSAAALADSSRSIFPPLARSRPKPAHIRL